MITVINCDDDDDDDDDDEHFSPHSRQEASLHTVCFLLITTDKRSICFTLITIQCVCRSSVQVQGGLEHAFCCWQFTAAVVHEFL